MRYEYICWGRPPTPQYIISVLGRLPKTGIAVVKSKKDNATNEKKRTAGLPGGKKTKNPQSPERSERKGGKGGRAGKRVDGGRNE
jgi:hypothetical protein